MNAEERKRLMEIESKIRTKPSEEELKSKFGKHWWKPSKYDDETCLAISRADFIKRTGIYRLWGVSYPVRLLESGFLGWNEIQEDHHKDLRENIMTSYGIPYYEA